MSNPKYDAFAAAVETGSFKGAAEALGYTQAGISYMIGALEQELGCALFTRDRSGVRLTEDGRALAPWIQDVRRSERALQTRVEEVRDLEAGTVRIGAFASTAINWLPGIVSAFACEHPGIALEMSCIEQHDDLKEALWRGELDCAFVITPTKSTREFHVVPLAQDPLFVVVAPDHPRANEPSFSREALASEPYIKVRDDSYTEFDALFERHGVTPNVRFCIDNDFAAMGLVAQGLGFGIFPKLLLERAPFALACLEPEVPTHREIALATRSMKRASFATKAFMACAQTWVEAHVNESSSVPRTATPERNAGNVTGK